MNKLQILQSYFLTKKKLKWSRERIEAWHGKGKRAIVEYAKGASPFYRSLYGSMKDFSKLPIISKKEMMDAFKFFNTAGISKDEAIRLATEGEIRGTYDSSIRGITVGLSSGTSGTRGIFLASRKEASLWCGNILAKTLNHSIFSKEKIALFLRAHSNLYKTASWLRYFPLNGEYDAVKDYDPDIVVAPPSVLRKLPSIRPKKIISAAEVLESLDRKILEGKFQQPIHELYQCTEGFLGFTCKRGTLHLNEDVLHFEKEYVDRKTGRFIPIITDLCRKTQPMIRYRLDDVLIEGKCDCGSFFQAIQGVEGRLKDVIAVIDECGEEVFLFPREIGELFSTDYLLHQTDQKTLHLYGGSEKALKQYLSKKRIAPLTIHTYPQLPTRKDHEKLRRVMRSY